MSDHEEFSDEERWQLATLAGYQNLEIKTSEQGTGLPWCGHVVCDAKREPVTASRFATEEQARERFGKHWHPELWLDQARECWNALNFGQKDLTVKAMVGEYARVDGYEFTLHEVVELLSAPAPQICCAILEATK